MLTKETSIINDEGFHLRPAQVFAHESGQFQCELKVVTEDGRSANPKSSLGLMGLGLAKGDKITLIADGADEDEALNKLIELIDNGFGE